MSILLRLYPRAWRERYGDELVALLEEHPATLVDLFDLIRGALDARLHPQVRGSAVVTDKEIPVNHRLLGVLAGIGGLAWLIGFATLLAMPVDEYGFPDSSIALVVAVPATALIGIALGELGTRPGSATSRQSGHLIAIASIAMAGLMLLPWPIFTIGLMLFPIIAMGAAVRGASQNGVFPGWFSALVIVSALASMIGYLGGLGQDVAIVLMAGIGVSGVALAFLAFRPRASTPPAVVPV